MMKKAILLIAFVVAPLMSYGQSIYDKLEDMDGVDAVIVNKDAFEILSKFNMNTDDNDFVEAFNMIKDLDELKFFSTKKSSIATQMESMVKQEVKSKKLTELMRIKEGNSRVTIYAKLGNNKDFVSDVLMFIKGIEEKTDGFSEAAIVSLTGTIDINKMSKLADTFSRKGNIKVKTKKQK